MSVFILENAPTFNLNVGDITSNGNVIISGNLTVSGTITPSGGGGSVILPLPNGAFDPASKIACNNATFTEVTESVPFVLGSDFDGNKLLIDFNAVLTVFPVPVSADILIAYAEYSKNGGAYVSLSPNSQISNAVLASCSMRVFGITADTFSDTDTVAFKFYVKTTVANHNVSCLANSWYGTIQAI